MPTTGVGATGGGSESFLQECTKTVKVIARIIVEKEFI
jgi:hypothetical protein